MRSINNYLENWEIFSDCKKCIYQTINQSDKNKYLNPNPNNRSNPHPEDANNLEKMSENEPVNELKKFSLCNKDEFLKFENLSVKNSISQNLSNIEEPMMNKNQESMFQCEKNKIDYNKVNYEQVENKITTVKTSEIDFKHLIQKIKLAEKLVYAAKNKLTEIDQKKRLKDVVDKGEERRQAYIQSGRPQLLRDINKNKSKK